jgi:DeoR family transcriptional regulator of aga operon
VPTDVTLPAAVRRERIAELVERQGFVRVTELRDRFGTSEVTLRADLDALAEASVLQRIHGGALATSGARPAEQPFERVSLSAAGEKRAIGRASARLVESGQTVILDVGTTTTAIAAALLERTDLSDVVVVTSALNIALALESAIPRFTVIVSGGTLRPLQHSLVDPLAGTVLDHIHADLAFIGCSGIDPATGITNVNLPESDVKRRMLSSSARSIVVADGSKLGVTQQSRVAPLAAINTIVTDDGADPVQVARLKAAGATVLLAES